VIIESNCPGDDLYEFEICARGAQEPEEKKEARLYQCSRERRIDPVLTTSGF